MHTEASYDYSVGVDTVIGGGWRAGTLGSLVVEGTVLPTAATGWVCSGGGTGLSCGGLLSPPAGLGALGFCAIWA